jgi:hypothetical protein
VKNAIYEHLHAALQGGKQVSVKAVFWLYEGCMKALLRLYERSVRAVFKAV